MKEALHCGLGLDYWLSNLMIGGSAVLLWRTALPLIIIVLVLLFTFITSLHWEIKYSIELLLHTLHMKGVLPFLSTLIICYFTGVCVVS